MMSAGSSSWRRIVRKSGAKATVLARDARRGPRIQNRKTVAILTRAPPRGGSDRSAGARLDSGWGDLARPVGWRPAGLAQPRRVPFAIRSPVARSREEVGAEIAEDRYHGSRHAFRVKVRSTRGEAERRRKRAFSERRAAGLERSGPVFLERTRTVPGSRTDQATDGKPSLASERQSPAALRS